jgi:hypothetical protein
VQWFGCAPVEPNHFERDNRTAPPFLQRRFAPGHADFPRFLQFLFNLHAYSKAQLALSSSFKWPLLHQTIPKS